jgi:hypothetical protein
LIAYPIALVSHQNPFWINRNRQNKSASRICQDAATSSIGPLDHVSCLGPLVGACNRTVQIIKAQVQKQAPKCLNFWTWAHIIPVVNRNHERFRPNSITSKIASSNITHHTLRFTST